MISNMQKGIKSLWNGLKKSFKYCLVGLFLICSPPVLANTCINNTVYAEARGESKVGQEAVAHVILNRAKTTGKTPCGIVREAGQFKSKPAPKGFSVNLTNPDPTRGATHFQIRNLSKWLGLRKYITIGQHTFYGR